MFYVENNLLFLDIFVGEKFFEEDVLKSCQKKTPPADSSTIITSGLSRSEVAQ